MLPSPRFFFKLGYSCFTMLCQFLLYNEVNQLYASPSPHSTFHPSRSPQSNKLNYLRYTAGSYQLCILHIVVQIQEIYASNSFYIPSTPLCPHIHSLCLFFYSCPANMFICTIFYIILFIYIIFGCARSSLLCGLFSSCGKQRLLSSCSAWASRCSGFSRCRAQALRHVGFNSCGTWAHQLPLLRLQYSCDAWAQLLCSMWDLSRPGIKPTSLALAGRFFTTEPPEKLQLYHFLDSTYMH